MNDSVSVAIDRGDAPAFCHAILPSVSRTFALGIKLLRGTLGDAVLDAYLLCRIADTIEDAPGISPDDKSMLFDRFLAGFDDSTSAVAFAAQTRQLTGDRAHLTLTQHADLVFAHFARLPHTTRAVVRDWVTEMANGMRKFVLLYPDGIRIQTLDEYREYCYYVAGTVGYMLTDLWQLHSPSVDRRRHALLREYCREFAEALQTVNILKDVAVDAEHENSIYVPSELLLAKGSAHATITSSSHLIANRAALGELIELAINDLELARRYLLLLPRRAISIRLFCLFPLLLAYATLRDLSRSSAMLQPGGNVKITRREVKTLLAMGFAVVSSNRLVTRLIRRVQKRRPPISGPATPRAPAR